MLAIMTTVIPLVRMHRVLITCSLTTVNCHLKLLMSTDIPSDKEVTPTMRREAASHGVTCPSCGKYTDNANYVQTFYKLTNHRTKSGLHTGLSPRGGKISKTVFHLHVQYTTQEGLGTRLLISYINTFFLLYTYYCITDFWKIGVGNPSAPPPFCMQPCKFVYTWQMLHQGRIQDFRCRGAEVGVCKAHVLN